MELILSYFPNLTDLQKDQMSKLLELYKDWNSKINVVSRKDIDNLYLHHVLHSLTIAKFIEFKEGSAVLDLGTGGGFPGVPLAILFPKVKFHLVDSINKKLNVVREVCQALNISNVSTQHTRVEDIKKMKFDFVVTRAVAPMAQIFRWSKKHLSDSNINSIPNGIIALKGGNLRKELKDLPRGEYYEQTKITEYFKEKFFIEKYLVYLQG